MKKLMQGLILFLCISSPGYCISTDLNAVYSTPDNVKPIYWPDSGQACFLEPAPFSTRICRIGGDFGTALPCNGAPNCSGNWGLTPVHQQSKALTERTSCTDLYRLPNPGGSTDLFLTPSGCTGPSCGANEETISRGACPSMPAGDFRWHPTQQNIAVIVTDADINGFQSVYWYDVVNCTVVRRWPIGPLVGYTPWVGIGRYQGNISNDGRWLPLVTEAPSTGTVVHFAILDMNFCPSPPECGTPSWSIAANGTQPCDLNWSCTGQPDCDIGTWGCRKLDWATITQDGHYGIVKWTNPLVPNQSAIRVWDFDQGTLTLTAHNYTQSECVDETACSPSCPASTYGNGHDGFVYPLGQADTMLNAFDANQAVLAGTDLCGKYGTKVNVKWPQGQSGETFSTNIQLGRLVQVNLNDGSIASIEPYDNLVTNNQNDGARATLARSVSGRRNTKQPGSWIFTGWDNDTASHETKKYGGELTVNRLIGPPPNNNFAIERWAKHHSKYLASEIGVCSGDPTKGCYKNSDCPSPQTCCGGPQGTGMCTGGCNACVPEFVTLGFQDRAAAFRSNWLSHCTTCGTVQTWGQNGQDYVLYVSPAPEPCP